MDRVNDVDLEKYQPGSWHILDDVSLALKPEKAVTKTYMSLYGEELGEPGERGERSHRRWTFWNLIHFGWKEPVN